MSQEILSRAARGALKYARCIVVKLGTPVVTHMDGNIALGRIAAVVEQIATLREKGLNVVIVTSGAIGTGSVRMRRQLALKKTVSEAISQQPNGAQNGKPVDRLDQNAAAAVGQSLLMNMYEVLFSTYNLSSAQVLITEGHLDDHEVLQQVSDTTAELLQLGTIPIINENDAVTGRTQQVINVNNEVAWDNDVLAWRLAAELRADVLVLMTDMDALYTRPAPEAAPKRLDFYAPHAAAATPPGEPRPDEAGLLEALVHEGLPSIHGMGTMGNPNRSNSAFAQRTRLSREGLKGVVTAATLATRNGVRAAVVTTGHHPRSLLQIMAGEDTGTLFVSSSGQAPLPPSRL